MHGMGGTKKAEYIRTAEALVDIANKQGVYFAIALLVDASYSMEDVKKILPILGKTNGSMKRNK